MTTTNSIPGPAGERRRRIERFGSHVELRVLPPDGHRGHAERRLDRAEMILEEFDARLSRFDPHSELCALNADEREAVPASPMMQRFVEAVSWAGRRSDGLVDATLLDAVEAAGYREHLPLEQLDAGARLVGDAGALLSRAAHPTGTPQAWRFVGALGGAVHRPLGVRLDSGGIGKGLAADLAAEALRGATSWLVDCGGDLRLGGTSRRPRPIDVRDPLDPERVLHRLHVTSGGVATSGITRRRWTSSGTGALAHHLIDPRTGRPADTGVLQATALAPTALEAEVLAKTAILRGGDEAHAALHYGGVIVHDSGVVEVVAPPRVMQRDRQQAPQAQFRLPAGLTWAVSR